MKVEQLERMLIHPRFGIINDLTELQVNPGDPNLHFYAAQLPNLEAWTGFRFEERSSAAGLSRSHSVMAAIGEAVERYATAVAPAERTDLIWATYRELGPDAIDPSAFATYAPAQYIDGYPFAPANPDTPMRWVVGSSLTRGCQVYVPAQYVFLPFDPLPGEPVLMYHTSTGSACGASFEEASVSGLCEVIERDAFMIHWQCKIAAPKVDLSSDGALWAEFQARYARPGISYHVWDYTTDIDIPVYFVAVTEDRPTSVTLAVGAAARTHPTAAVRKALLESVQTRVWLRQMSRSTGLKQITDWFDVRTFEDHVHLWGSPDMLAHAEFLLHSPNRATLRPDPPPCTAQEQLAILVAKLALAKLDAIVVDITPADIRSLGLTVVRALIPGCIPLSSDHRFEPLGGQRLYTVPSKLGHRAPANLGDFNPVPHPFP